MNGLWRLPLMVVLLLVSSGASALDLTPHGTQPGLIYSMLPSDGCGGCHGGSSGTDPEFRPHSTWGGSMMANATRDPLFWAAVDVANKDFPGAGDFCLRCHTSQGWYGGRVVKAGFGAVNDPVKGANGCLLEGTPDALDFSNDYSGVACHFCHRLMPTGPLGEPGMIGNANVWLDDAACSGSGEPCRRGPYTYSGGFSPPHAWAQSTFHEDSKLCGSCHDVTTPDTDAGPLKTLKLADGTDTSIPFPIERTYSEWKQSDFSGAGGQTCQGCHMPDSEDPTATACSGGPSRTGNLPVHTFVGGNTWVPGIIKGEYSDTSAIPGSGGGLGRQDDFDRTIQAARDLLQTAADVEVSLLAYSAASGGSPGSIDARVKVTNHSGHKLPSGYSEGRRMWLNVQLRDFNGVLIFESGNYDDASAVLASDPQLRVYEVLQGIWNRNGTGSCDAVDGLGREAFHFVLNDCVAKDNRIPPLGFEPATVADPNGYELRPVGINYPETSPGSGILVNYDEVDYAATIPPGTPGPLTVTARLYYQTSSREYMEFLRNQAIERTIPGENLMCAGGPNRPAVVGPKDRSRGEYMWQLWNGPQAGDRIFANSFDDTVFQQGYGKSPPETIASGSVFTP
ncbi:MAG TPA: hypothetical protein VFN25_14085 [Dokdonella sp.]|uniref:hypothetical protein n=1 Tax=Dokdonella sp. TaxID=2291710 RepID=UPI002D804DC2|nr:hypothetical protein [Dokdonella sp.]HET9034018.1 hypothetical protein [Dokdonella sp.]